MKLFKRAVKRVAIEETVADKKKVIERELMRREREATQGLFGPLETGRARDFFCLDEYTWVWYEEWAEEGIRKSMTTHYHVTDDEIVKSQNGALPERLTDREVQHFVAAVEKYDKIAQSQLYS